MSEFMRDMDMPLPKEEESHEEGRQITSGVGNVVGRKYLVQNFEDIDPIRIIDYAVSLRDQSYRLGQICATALDDSYELIYSFDKDLILHNIRTVLPRENDGMNSITRVYWSAFIYENEMHDLFGIEFKHSELDYKGGFFKLAQKTPWAIRG